MKIRLFVATLASVLAATVGSAFADVGKTTGPTPIYQDKSVNSASLGTMPEGTSVEGVCYRDAWCQISGGGLSGWAQNFTVILNRVSPQQPQPVPLPQPVPNPGWPWPPRPQPQPQPPRPTPPIFQDAGACFFSERSFRGQSFCVDEGDSYSRLRNWDNVIRSVQVFGGARVDLCSDSNFRGDCVTVRQDASRLPTQLDRRASSIDVY